MTFNTWRRFDKSAMRSPLAMCDARSIAEADLIPTALANYGAGQAKSAAERIDEGIGQFDIFQASASPAHKWNYYPKMDRDEVLVFKTFDSKIPVRSALAHWQFGAVTTRPHSSCVST